MPNKPMSLGEAQRLFFHLNIRWATWAELRGYSFTYGEGFRTDEQAEINAMGETGRAALAALLRPHFPDLAVAVLNNGKNNGIRKTVHGISLAHDYNAFKNGVYLVRTEDWQELGEYWESLHELCRWGGHFGDGNHLSFEWQGVK